MEMMADAGLSPLEVLQSSSGVAADCLGLKQLGVLEPGRWADFVVFAQDPLADITNTKTLEAVYIAGRQLGGADAAAE